MQSMFIGRLHKFTYKFECSITVSTLFNESKVFLRGRLSLMGTSDMNSTPPAITVSQLPLATRPIAKEEKRNLHLEKVQMKRRAGTFKVVSM